MKACGECKYLARELATLRKDVEALKKLFECAT